MHPFAEHRAVIIATRRPLSKILGTEAARIAEHGSVSHQQAWETRRAMQRARDPLLMEVSMSTGA